jgi:dinuclear metal center YbgI/SA1388 family protein
MVELKTLVTYLGDLLEVKRFNDYAPNGLQVEGKPIVEKIVSGVTASLALIEAAIDENADALLVHHGYFWKGENPCIQGMKQKRIKQLLQHDISLLAYHLPLDAHPVLGNNAGLADLLELETQGVMDKQGIGNVGLLKHPMAATDFALHVGQKLGRKPLLIEAGNHPIFNIAWCSGGAQKYLVKAAALGVDAFLSGEISENTVHEAKELGLHYIAAGHHATERCGVQQVGLHLAEAFSIQQVFVDIYNPV